MSDTPRTDSAAVFVPCFPDSSEGMEVVDAGLARQIERELEAMRHKLMKAVGDAIPTAPEGYRYELIRIAAEGDVQPLRVNADGSTYYEGPQ